MNLYAPIAPTPAVFLDRDGTIMIEVDYCRDPAKVALIEGAQEALGRLRAAGFALVIVTNQSGIGRGYFSEKEYHAVHARLIELLGEGLILDTYFCPDAPDTPSERRKPAPGMLVEAAHTHRLDLARSWMVGDKRADVLAGRAAGVRSVLVRTGHGAEENAEGAEFVAKDIAAAVEFILRTSDAR